MSELSLPGLAMLAVIAAAWRQVSGVLTRIRGLVIERVQVEGDTAWVTGEYLLKECPYWTWGDRHIDTTSGWVRPRSRVLFIALEQMPKGIIVARFGKRWVMARRRCLGHNAGGDDAVGAHDSLVLFLRKSRRHKILEELTKAALDWSAEKAVTGKRYRVYNKGAPKVDRTAGPAPVNYGPNNAPPKLPHSGIRPTTRMLHWSLDDVGAPTDPSPFDRYHMGAAARACHADFQRCLGLKEWYKEKGIPWRRAYLLYGSGGTGKTALVRAMAQEADLPVFKFDLAGMSNTDFNEAWVEVQEMAPCVTLFDDFDNVFHGRRNVTCGDAGEGSRFGGPMLTFDSILQALGGIEPCHGVFTFITTNHIELIDPALGRPLDENSDASTRPGRVDKVYHIKLPSWPVRYEIVHRICGDIGADDVEKLTEGMSGAQVTEWAMERALAAKWNDEHELE